MKEKVQRWVRDEVRPKKKFVPRTNASAKFANPATTHKEEEAEEVIAGDQKEERAWERAKVSAELILGETVEQSSVGV
jgi:hypothetical protein